MIRIKSNGIVDRSRGLGRSQEGLSGRSVILMSMTHHGGEMLLVGSKIFYVGQALFDLYSKKLLTAESNSPILLSK